MAKNLLKMNFLEELSLVDNPANQHASVAVFKRASAPTRKGFAAVFKRFVDAVAPHVKKEAQSYAATRAVSLLWERNNALSNSISSILSDDSTADVKAAQLDVTLSQFRDDIQSLIEDDAAFAALDTEPVGKAGGETETPDPAAPAPGAEVIPPSVAEPTAGASSDTPAEQGNIMKTTPLTFTEVGAANAHIIKLTTDLNAAVEKVDVLEAAADPIASITKGMAPAAAEMFRKQQETITKLQADGALVVLVAKAKAIAKNSGADLDKLALVLKAISGNVDAEAFVTDVFAKYDAMLTEMEGMVVGSGEEVDGGDANAALDAAVADVQKANPTFSRAQAVRKALDTNPALYDETELSDAVAG